MEQEARFVLNLKWLIRWGVCYSDILHDTPKAKSNSFWDWRERVHMLWHGEMLYIGSKPRYPWVVLRG